MKRAIIVTVAIVVGSILIGSLAAFGVANADSGETVNCETKKTINVSGNGIVTVKPDKFTISFTVWTQDKSARDAQQLNDTKANALIAALLDNEVAEEDMKTISYRLDSVYKWNDVERVNEMVGYKAVYTLSVTCYDLASMGEMIDLATSKGVNEIGSISYGIKNKELITTEALRLAMKDAKQKAEIALGVYDLEVKGVEKIYLNTYDPVTPVPYYEKGDMDGRGGAGVSSVAPSIMSGDLTFTVNVNVEFEF